MIRDRTVVNLQHLRRFVKQEHLPDSLTRSNQSLTCAKNENSPKLGSDAIVLDNAIEWSSTAAPLDSAYQPALHLLICAASVLPLHQVLQSLFLLDVFKNRDSGPQIRMIPIPLLPPTSEEQAQSWSEKYWPTVYKRNNPFGPHPSIISRTEQEIRKTVGDWMELARFAGNEASEEMRGEPVGAVIVDRNALTGAAPVVVAGDARWNNTGQAALDGGGNVMAHAVMRAIGMVAHKRRVLLGPEYDSANELDSLQIFADNPVSEIEDEIYSKTTLSPGGYLCLDLELYVSHEPCVMCSMAILHSRFGKVIFGKCLPRTGGISADMDSDVGNGETGRLGVGYGLFWRPELNWKLLAWQWVDDDSPPKELNDANTHA